MVTTCCVQGCKKRFNKNVTIPFFRIPQKPPERREQWVKAINRAIGVKGELWQPSKHHRVCGEHFITGTPIHDPLHPDYVPNKKLGYAKKSLSTRRYDNIKRREEQKMKMRADEKQREEAASILLDIQENATVIPRHFDKGTQTYNDVTQNIFILKSHIRTLEKEIQIVHKMNIKLRTQVEDLKEEARTQGKIFSVNMQNCLTPMEQNPALVALLCARPVHMDSNRDAASSYKNS